MHRYRLYRSPGDGDAAPAPVAPAPVVPAVVPAIVPAIVPAPTADPGPIPYARFQEVNTAAQAAKADLAKANAELSRARMERALLTHGVRATDLDEAAGELLERWQRIPEAERPELGKWIGEIKTKKFAAAYFDSAPNPNPPTNGAAVPNLPPNLPPPAGNPNGGAAGSAPAASDPFSRDRVAGMDQRTVTSNMAEILKSAARDGEIAQATLSNPHVARALAKLGQKL